MSSTRTSSTKATKLVISRSRVACDRSVLARSVMLATRPSATLRAPSMVADMSVYQSWAVRPLACPVSGASPISPASVSCADASSTADPLTVLSKYFCSAWFADASKSAWSAVCDW